MLAGMLWIWKSSHSRALDRLKPAGGINSNKTVVGMMLMVVVGTQEGGKGSLRQDLMDHRSLDAFIVCLFNKTC